MKTDATSLDRLNDLVVPPAVPWWPLAPGWYVVLVLLALATAWLSWRLWQRYKRQAYRREALHQLTSLQDVTSIAELLRRTALAVVPRADVASKTGEDWGDWLAAQSGGTMPDEVRELLSVRVYSRHPGTEQDISLLHSYCARWIVSHKHQKQNI